MQSSCYAPVVKPHEIVSTCFAVILVRSGCGRIIHHTFRQGQIHIRIFINITVGLSLSIFVSGRLMSVRMQKFL